MIKNDIILFGKPGSGKGTLAKDLLLSDTALKHLSTGKIFRSNVDKQTALGVEISETLAEGEMITDELTIAVVEDFLQHQITKPNNIILFDGFPRNSAQLQWLMQWYIDNDNDFPIMVELEADDDLCIKRIQQRAVIENRPEDSDIDIITKRINDYYAKTDELLDAFSSFVNDDHVITIDATGTAKQTLKQFYKALI